MSEILAAFFLVGGASVALVAAIGVARLPDAFLRMHAATKAGVVGTGMVLLGAGFAFGTTEAWMRVALILVFLLITTPVASHALGRAAYIRGTPMWSGTITDQLQGVLAPHVFDIDPSRVPRAQRHGEAPRLVRRVQDSANGVRRVRDLILRRAHRPPGHREPARHEVGDVDLGVGLRRHGHLARRERNCPGQP